MNAIAKMDELGLKRLHAALEALRPGLSLQTLYKWRGALSDGRGIRDENKRVLIEATAATEHAIVWADFLADAEPRP